MVSKSSSAGLVAFLIAEEDDGSTPVVADFLSMANLGRRLARGGGEIKSRVRYLWNLGFKKEAYYIL